MERLVRESRNSVDSPKLIRKKPKVNVKVPRVSPDLIDLTASDEEDKLPANMAPKTIFFRHQAT